MDTTQPSQPFDKTDYTALYIHYQERGAEIKGQMISTLTLLYAVLATLVGFLWSGGDNALVGSWVGLALSTFSLYLVSDFRKHMNRNYTLSKAVLCACTVLDDGVENIGGQSLKKLDEGARSWCNPRKWRLFLDEWFLVASWALTLFFVYLLAHYSSFTFWHIPSRSG